MLKKTISDIKYLPIRVHSVIKCLVIKDFTYTLSNIIKGRYPYRTIEILDLEVPIFLKPDSYVFHH